jgi:hypothetical protein
MYVVTGADDVFALLSPCGFSAERLGALAVVPFRRDGDPSPSHR